jgi:hypothetical protein
MPRLASTSAGRTCVVALAGLSAAITLAVPRAAHAEDLIISQPGQHPSYALEIEPHADFTFFDLGNNLRGLGLGARLSVPIVKNGFVSSINDSVAIGVGIDALQYSGCSHTRFGDCGSITTIFVPVVMQWNFWLSTHWSLLGEPGVAIYHWAPSSTCIGDYCDARTYVEPVLFVGGRYHFAEHAALTMRVGWPYWSVGVSFL